MIVTVGRDMNDVCVHGLSPKECWQMKQYTYRAFAETCVSKSVNTIFLVVIVIKVIVVSYHFCGEWGMLYN